MTRSLSSTYDEIADVLYISTLPAPDAEGMEDEAGLILRYDQETHMPMGATIMDYNDYWSQRKEYLTLRIADFFHIPVRQAKRLLTTETEKNA